MTKEECAMRRMVAKYSIDKEQERYVNQRLINERQQLGLARHDSTPLSIGIENQSEQVMNFYGLSDNELVERFGGSFRRQTTLGVSGSSPSSLD